MLSGQEVIKKLAKGGYRIVRQKGSHVRLRNLTDPSAKPVTVPLHLEIKAGLLRQIIKDSGLTVEEFTNL